jgi:hypothetical protein
MNHCLLRRLGLGLAIAAAAAAPAQAKSASSQTPSTPVDTSTCTAPTLTQPFLSWQDSNWYALAAGQTVDSFNGAGWVLSGGAKIVTTTLADGATGSVLDLPSGSKAVSPTICLTSDYPSARMMVSNLSGSNGATVDFSVSYAGTSSATSPLQTGTFKTTGYEGVSGGWERSDPVALQPSSSPGWQPMQITLTPSGPKNFEVYNLYVDPRAKA